jgi:uncharacterized phage infection (PIP) family protein YhgE
MKVTNKSFFSRLTAIAVLSGVFVFYSEADAQQATRRLPTPTPRPAVSPTPPSDIPEVISRANDYLTSDENINPEDESAEKTKRQTETESLTEQLNKRIKELNSRIQSLESNKQNQYDEKQKRLLLNMDILSRAEQRAESLRKQLFEVIDKESQIQTRLDQLSFDLRPEMLERSVAFAGSLRPEEIRETRRKSLDSEKRNLENLLTQIQNSRLSLERNVQKADELVEKVRFKLEKEIDDALIDEPQPSENL